MSDHQPSRKRGREPEPETTTVNNPLKEFIVALTNLGDPHAKITFEEELKLCCNDIKSLWALEQHTVSDAVVECLMGLPHKTSKYTLLLALLMSEHQECASGVVSRLSNMFLMEEKPWWLMGQLLRIFSELSSLRVVATQSLIKLLDAYVGSFPRGNAVVSMHYGFPFAIKVLSADYPDQCQKYIAIMEEILSKQQIASSAVCQNINYAETFKKILSNVDSSPLIRISPVDSDLTPLCPNIPEELRFSFEESHDLPIQVLQKSTVIEPNYADSWEELISYRYAFHILACASFNPRKCCDLLFSAIPETIGSGEKIVAQMLFGSLLSEKKTNHVLNAEFIMISACRHSRLFPSAMARCLLRLVDLMNDSQINHFQSRALASWFAIHLSTFDFKWPWDEWKAIVDLPDHNGRVIFLTFTFEYLIRLSYYEKLTTAIPAVFHGLLPPAPKPYPCFENDEVVGNIIASIKSKKPCEELLQSINVAEEKFKFLEALLLAGSKSFSHVSVLFDRYMVAIKLACGEEVDQQAEALSIISGFWKHQVQNFELIVCKLLEEKVLNGESFVQWSLKSLESSINESSMPLFNALKRFLPTAILMSGNVKPHMTLLATSLETMKGDIVADKQVTDVIADISRSIARF